MAFFIDPFEGSSINNKEKISKLNIKLKNLYGAKLDSYVFVKGALDANHDLKEMFLQEKYVPENFRQRYLEQDERESGYIEILDTIQKSLSVEKPSAEAYHSVSEALKDEHINKRFESDLYFSKRERHLFFHLEFLFNEDPIKLLNNILPRLDGVKTKNMFSLLRFNIFDSNCNDEIQEKDSDDIKKLKTDYLIFCEKCIQEISRFGNMREDDGYFTFIGIEENREVLFNLSVKLLLTFLDINLSKYLEVEISKDELDFLDDIESGRKLIEHARIVKKPMKDIEEAQKLTEDLEKLRILIQLADLSGLITEIKDRKLGEYAQELITIIEDAQGLYLTEHFREAKIEILGVEESEEDEIAKNEELGTLDEKPKDTEVTEIEDDSKYILEYSEAVSPQETSSDKAKEEIQEAIKSIKDIETKIESVKLLKDSKSNKIAKLIKDSKRGEPYYYKYLNRILYVLRFFRFDTSILMRDFLLQCNKSNGFSSLKDDVFDYYKSDNKTTVEAHLKKSHAQLTYIYQQQFSGLKRFETGFELSKQINSLLLTLSSTIKELNIIHKDSEE